MFIDGDRRVNVSQFSWLNDSDSDKDGMYTFEQEMQGKKYYLLHSNQSYLIQLSGLPDSTNCDLIDSSLVLIKLGSASHSWDVGQRLFSLGFDVINEHQIMFTMPRQKELNIVPAYYMMFFVDCMGKPSNATMVRFDNQANSPLQQGSNLFF